MFWGFSLQLFGRLLILVVFVMKALMAGGDTSGVDDGGDGGGDCGGFVER